MKKITIIAEAGVNHCGKLSLAKKMVDAAKKFEADYIKFQSFNPDLLAAPNAKLAAYQKKNTNYSNQNKMLKKLCLTKNEMIKLNNYCIQKKIGFLSTAFDIESAKFLLNFNMHFAKIPSGEITNFPLIKFLAQNFKKIILSTGMSTIDEIEWAINQLIRFGIKRNNITLLHCTSAYPAPVEDLNLNAIKFLKNKFRVNVGYSDHTMSVLTPIIATNLGATLVEKHFTLNKNFKGPDHKASIDSKEFLEVINGIKFSQKTLGKKEKKCTASEKKNKRVVRKSIYAFKDIKKGEIFNEKNLITLRPDNGVSASEWENVIGKKSKFYFKKNQKIKLK